MHHRSSFSTEWLTASTGLLAVCAALTGALAIAVSMLEQQTQLYIAEGAIAVLLIALALREYSARLHVQRHTRALSKKVREVEEKNRLLNLTEARAAVGHWRLDLATNRVFWSQGTFAIHGLPPGKEPALDQAIEMYHPDDRAIVEQAVARARETGDSYTFRARLIRPDNEVRYTEASALIEFDAANEPVAMIGVFRDRTEEEEMQRDLRAARDEANALAEAKSAFLAKMSHEIRTPMNGVLGFVDLLLTTDLNQSQRRHADFIAESGRVLQTLLNDILDLTKIEAGHVQVDVQPVNIAHLIQRTKQLAEPSAHQNALCIEHRVDPALPMMVLVDGLRLRQIITNLMHNAVRFTDEGKIKLSAMKRGDRLVIEVADTGVGIAPEQQEQMFNPFVQANEPGDMDRGGTGLGLAICRQLTELMDGTLSLQSRVGQGSTFTLSLPLEPAETAQPAPTGATVQASDRTSKLAGRRVLLAEDFDINRELMTEMAQRIGIVLEHAADGQEAVDMACEARTNGNPYELILMDVRMPNMDGLEATRALREHGFTPADLPIVALTANAFADDVEACLNAGMQQHLAKPISVERLRASLNEWLPDTRLQAA